MSLRTMLTRLCLYLKISRNILHRSQQLAIWTVYTKTNLQIKHTLSDFWSRRCLWQISQKLGRQSENMSFTCPSIIPLKFKSIVSRPDLHDVKIFLTIFCSFSRMFEHTKLNLHKVFMTPTWNLYLLAALWEYVKEIRRNNFPRQRSEQQKVPGCPKKAIHLTMTIKKAFFFCLFTTWLYRCFSKFVNIYTGTNFYNEE